MAWEDSCGWAKGAIESININCGSLSDAMATMNGSGPPSGGGGGVSPSELASMLRKSADIIERKEFHPLLFQTMKGLTAYAGEYADGGPPATGAASSTAAASAAQQQQQQSKKSSRRNRDRDTNSSTQKDRGEANLRKSAFADVPDSVLDSDSKSKKRGNSFTFGSASGGAAAAAERVGVSGGQFSSAATAAGGGGSNQNKQDNAAAGKGGPKGLFSGLKGIKKGIEKVGADILYDKAKEDVPFDEQAWCDTCFTRGCSCKSRKNAANLNNGSSASDANLRASSVPNVDSAPGQQQPQQPPSNNTLNDPDKPSKPCFQRPINPSSNLIANGWIDQQRRSKMRVVWKDVLASLVEGRRPGEETTLWIQRQVTNQATGKVTGLEALHQIPMKWLEDVNYVDIYGDHRFTLKVHNIAEEFYFRTRDEQSAQSWVLTLRSARDASLEGNSRMGGGGMSGNGSVATEKSKPSAKDMGLHDLEDWDQQPKSQEQPPLAQAGSDGGGVDSRRPSSAPQEQPQQPQQQTSGRMKISELRAIAHGADYDTRGMERQDLERIAAYVRSGAYNPQTASASSSSAGPSDNNQSRQQDTAMREAEQRAAAERREKEQQAAREVESARVENMRRDREEAEKKRVEEQQQAQILEVKRRQEEERQRKMAEFARQQQQAAQQQQAQAAAAAADRKKREEEEQRLRWEEEQRRRQQQQQQAHQQQQGHSHIPTPPASGGFPQQQAWGQPQQQQHYQQNQWHQQHPQQQQQQQQHPQHFFNQQQAYQNQQHQQQFQQQQHQQQHQQQPQQQQQQQQQAPSSGNSAVNHSKYMESKESDEEQSACTLQIKRSILINWALQPPNLNVLRPIDQLITTIHTAMPPAFGVTSHAYFSKFTPIPRTELVLSAAMGNHPDETKLKKAVRKVRVFLHPDKLPRDLTSDQQFMARMLWDITSDSWEEFEKHKDELDWIRS